MADGLRVDAVTFDFWNTLVAEMSVDSIRARRDAWFEQFAAAGLAVEAERIESALVLAWSEHHESWHRNEQYTWERAAQRALGHLDVPVDEGFARELLESFALANERIEPVLCAGVVDALAELSRLGARLGIICDVGFTPSTTLRAWLEGHGVLDYFTGWSFSDEVGWYKPAPQIFAHALAYLDAEPDRVAHVGDLRRTDVAGSRAAGLVSVRYRGAFDDTSDLPDAEVVVDHHDQLVAALRV